MNTEKPKLDDMELEKMISSSSLPVKPAVNMHGTESFIILEDLRVRPLRTGEENTKELSMVTQVEQLTGELRRAKVRLGEADPFVKALQRQLDGYRSMEANREQNFLVGTVPAKKVKDAPNGF